jgi:uncharacterized protein YegP (UPF0339 family)
VRALFPLKHICYSGNRLREVSKRRQFKMAARYELKPTKNGEVMFNLLAGNNEVILTSEMYKEKSGALNGIESVKTNSQIDEMFERKTASNGQFYFNLHAANKQVIGRSETYTTEAAMEKGIASVKHNGQVTEIKDLTAAAAGQA